MNFGGRRSLFGTALAYVFTGLLFLTPQTACLEDRYECGGKETTCSASPDQKSCEARYACEWRDGCVHGCIHAANPPSTCVTRCASSSGTSRYPQTEAECVGMSDCAWEPVCTEKPDLPCDSKLDEDECKRRNCSWDKVGPAL